MQPIEFPYPPVQLNGLVRVYLAGGLYSDWQEQVKAAANRYFGDESPFVFYDPMDIKVFRPDLSLAEVARIEKGWMRLSDVCFNYIEAANPRPYGSCTEVGFMAALDRHIIVVDEHNTRWTEWMKSGFAHYATGDFETGIEALMQYAERIVNARRQAGWKVAQSA